MDNITAVTLSKRDLPRSLEGVPVLTHVSRFSDAAGLLDARLAAIEKVQTEWFFFLDDDDRLPRNYLSVLEKCVAVDTPLAYTNELMNGILRRGKPYSQDEHLKNPLLIHHLTVCKTEAALRAAAVIPRGQYGMEPLLYFQMAKEGATWIDQVGYFWDRGPTGLSRDPNIARSMVTSMLWAKDNRS